MRTLRSLSLLLNTAYWHNIFNIETCRSLSQKQLTIFFSLWPLDRYQAMNTVPHYLSTDSSKVEDSTLTGLNQGDQACCHCWPPYAWKKMHFLVKCFALPLPSSDAVVWTELKLPSKKHCWQNPNKFIWKHHFFFISQFWVSGRIYFYFRVL